MNQPSSIASVLGLLLACSSLPGAGLSKSENFLVVTQRLGTDSQTQEFADRVLERAERYRTQIAQDWLNEELPPSVGRAIINVSFSDRHDRGRTWAIDSTAREYHNIYLETTTELAASTTLAHEITHVILATRFPHPQRLPAWIEEGIASRYDDARRIETRTKIVRWWQRTGTWPSMAKLFEQSSISSDDKTSYAMASSLVEYLLEQGDEQRLLTFAEEAAQGAWDAALRRHYEIENVMQLQAAWQAWTNTQR
jgi:hypothetical protein